MKYLLIYKSDEGEFLITNSNSEKTITEEYLYYSFRGIKGLHVLKTTLIRLEEIEQQ